MTEPCLPGNVYILILLKLHVLYSMAAYLGMYQSIFCGSTTKLGIFYEHIILVHQLW